MKLDPGPLTVRKYRGRSRWWASFHIQRVSYAANSPAAAVRAACEALAAHYAPRVEKQMGKGSAFPSLPPIPAIPPLPLMTAADRARARGDEQEAAHLEKAKA
jgi:hypothetical protein